jgi:hypothetical protein
MHAPCSGSGCAVHGFWSALDIAFGLLILIFLTRQRCEREQWSELKSREKPIGLVSLALGTGSVDGERRKIPIRIFERTERTPCLPSVIIYRYFFYRQWAPCVKFLCAGAGATRNRGISPTGASTDPWTASSRELHVQLLGKSRRGLPSFVDLDLTRAPRPDPAGDGEQAAALRERCRTASTGGGGCWRQENQYLLDYS